MVLMCSTMSMSFGVAVGYRSNLPRTDVPRFSIVDRHLGSSWCLEKAMRDFLIEWFDGRDAGALEPIELDKLAAELGNRFLVKPK